MNRMTMDTPHHISASANQQPFCAAHKSADTVLERIPPHPFQGEFSRQESKSDMVKSFLPFPWKVHEMLDAAEAEGKHAIISWLSDNAFRVHDHDEFTKTLMPRFFKQSRYKSFVRQLNLWGFERIQQGPMKGAYAHVNFVRGQQHMCRFMQRRTGGKDSTTNAPSSPLAVGTPRYTGSPTKKTPTTAPPKTVSIVSPEERPPIAPPPLTESSSCGTAMSVEEPGFSSFAGRRFYEVPSSRPRKRKSSEQLRTNAPFARSSQNHGGDIEVDFALTMLDVLRLPLT